MKKRVLVTGGARGIGRAIVEELVRFGYDVVATHYKTDDLVKGAQYLRVDLTDRGELDKFITQVGNREPIDVLVNNAGLWLGKPFEKTAKAELFEQIDLNLAAPTRLTHGLLPLLKKAEAPLVINVSSQAAHPIFPGEAAYSAVKSALSTLSNVLRTELNPLGIRVTTFEPWGVNTYGIKEPSGMVLPSELAKIVRYVIELPGHLQLDTVGISHIKQYRGGYPDWIEK
ncbi:hypothetical protein A3E49_01070 [Candidatus Saccharibacteria bacterium RIFCSPHIGHO2_12_FULL_49_19]|nr:MAG: hypothetical protein A3E49_01070 [Candidatus Saccharibacteria bacterium RIFCSPHIGHO2_12_FULL_49_19]